ncbi:MAG: hypothetical protein WC830_14110 [Burkholderiales bacterium]|jgi:hypothetical protein
MEHTQHSQIRAQQRGIPPLIIDLLIQFGVREPAGDGTEAIYFDKRAKKQLQAYSGGLMGKLSDALDVYAIVIGDKVVTIGPRYKRINRT